MASANSSSSPGSASPPSRDPLFASSVVQHAPPASHPELIFRLRTCYGVESPPRDLYENNKPFCTIDQGEILFDIGYHVRRLESPPMSADVVVTVGSYGDLWLPTNIPRLFAVVINPETNIPMIKLHRDAPTGSIVINSHEHRDSIYGSGDFVSPRFQGSCIKAGEAMALMPGHDYTLTVNTNHCNKKVVYALDVVWEDEPVWKIIQKIKLASDEHNQSLKLRSATDQPPDLSGGPVGRSQVNDVYPGTYADIRTGMEATVTKGTGLIDALDLKQIAIKRFSEANPWCNRKAALNEIKRLALIKHPNIVEYLGHDVTWYRNEVFLGWMDGNIEGLTFDITGPLSPRDLWSTLLLQMSLALDFLAARNIVHEDVQPGNILHQTSCNGHINFRLADFSNSGRSWARYESSWRPRDEAFYRPFFRAPEWTDLVQENDGGTRPSADVWALAMTMLCVTKRPHETYVPDVWDKVDQGLWSEAVQDAYYNIASGASHFEVLKLALLWFLLRRHPHERATAGDMTNCLQNLMGSTAQKQAAAIAVAAKATYRMRDLCSSSVEVGEFGLVVPLPRVDSSPSDVEIESPKVEKKESPEIETRKGKRDNLKIDVPGVKKETPKVDVSVIDVKSLSDVTG